ncbi:MAG: PAS domain S-box protein [Clostridia bacterium]|nr:PAS domain S-box protein [Clostridia bacterium]
MDAKNNREKDRITRPSLIKSGKIALFYFVFGVTWILVSDSLAPDLFSHLQDVVYFSIVKGLVYVLLSAIFILYVSYINFKKIFQSNEIEMLDKRRIEEQSALLKALVNATPDLIFYKDTEHRYIGCNKAFEEFVGLAEADLAGKTDYELFDRITAELFRQMDLEMISLGKSRKNEELVEYPDGHTVWLETNKSPFYDSAGSLVGLLGVSRDISESKALLLQLEKEKKQFETFINSSSEVIFLKDENFNHIMANKKLEEFLGVEESRIIGRTDYELMDAESAEFCRNTDKEAISRNETVGFTRRVSDKVFELRKFPVPIGENKIGVGAFIRDITNESKQREIINNISETNRIIAQCMMKPFSNIQEQLDYALHEALHLTESRYGYIFFYDEDKKEFSLNHWTAGVMDECAVIEKQTKYQLDRTGMWGEVVRQRRPIIVNDFDAPNPLIKGCPNGHVEIHKFMSLPIFENDKIVAVIGFANKKTDYSENDVQAMTLLMSGVWIATKRKEKEEETENLLRQTQAMINDHEAVMLIVEPASGKILEANSAATKFLGYSKAELLSLTTTDINLISAKEARENRLMAYNKEQKYFTIPYRLKNGEIKIVDIYSSPIEYNGHKVLFSIIFDVTKREESKKQNEYMAYHDYLTGLYNRRFFEEEFNRRNGGDDDGYPIAVLMGDVNGLKLYNDTFGHLEGDRALKDVVHRIQKYANSEDVIARIGGDEFAIIKFNTCLQDVKTYLDDIDKQVNYGDENKEGEALTISFGYSIQRKREDTLDALIKEAETFMFNRKYYSSKSARSNTVNVIMDALFTKSEREKNHSERVGLICKTIAEKMQLDRRLIDRIRVAGLLHDIGKIGINEGILNKDGKLDGNEWEIMKLHSAKGARILENTVEFYDIADIVLSHHEHFDGSGYPKGLKGEEIPLASRIICVADAYDAMTNTRSYRKAMSAEEAVKELNKYAGSQFDPEIVSVFVRSIEAVELPVSLE